VAGAVGWGLKEKNVKERLDRGGVPGKGLERRLNGEK